MRNFTCAILRAAGATGPSMHTFSRRLEPLVHRMKLQSHQAAVSPYPGGSPLVAAGVGVGWAACLLSAGRVASATRGPGCRAGVERKDVSARFERRQMAVRVVHSFLITYSRWRHSRWPIVLNILYVGCVSVHFPGD